ncbi:hypothetical protein KEM55_009023 [Ascosphaera atra]|nr:hypothetical protein KEM55_009023 [Ascosphaera atra]
MLRLFRPRPQQLLGLRGLRFASTETKPPMLGKLREDMKAAMKARDKPRSASMKLNVIKSIIGEMNNVSVPLKADYEVVKLIEKRQKALDAVSKEYIEAGRSDLVDQAAAEKSILAEYASSVPMMKTEEVAAVVKQCIQDIESEGKKPSPGGVFKILFSASGALDGKPVNRQTVKDLYDQMRLEKKERGG